MNKIKRYISVGILVTMVSMFSVIFAVPTYAQSVQPKTIPCIPNLPCVNETTQKSGDAVRGYVIGSFGSTFIQGFLGIAAVAAVIFIIVGGIQLHLAFGNDEGVGKAKKTLIWAIVGLVVSILSVGIVQIISNLPL